MTSTLRMTFNLNNGKTKTFALQAPKDDLTAEQVTGVMSTMVAKAAVVVDGAQLESSQGALIRKVDDTVLF